MGKTIIQHTIRVIVKEIFAMTLNGMGTCLIAKELNSRDIPGKKALIWYAEKILKNILTFSMYCIYCYQIQKNRCEVMR